jgi:hypothetical protein
MKTKNKALRWLLFASYLGIMSLIVACLGGEILFANAAPGTLQVDGNVVEMVDENGDAIPVGSEATFDIVAKLESTDPWTVAGKVLETNDTTQIDEGLQVDDLVRARGLILEDGTWLAISIQKVEEQSEPIIILIGKVETMDPWVVNGITLTVTDTTEIQGMLEVGMLVRVEILLHEDGTWEVLSITPLSAPTEIPDCTTVIATIVAVNGNEVQFLGWPITITLDENVSIENNQGDEDENDDEQSGVTNGILNSDQVVLVVICSSDNDQLMIVQIIILNADDESSSGSGDMVTVCHKPGKNQHTLTLPSSALPAHLGHGDTLGACP